MAKILLIESATEVCGVAISVDGTVIAIREIPMSSDHAALLTPFIEACTKESGIALKDLDAVAVSRGPGSYTSLRVGSSVAKGICYALGKPLIAVDTLKALAMASREDSKRSVPKILEEPHVFVSMMDARRMEVCCSIFDADLNPLCEAVPKILSDNMFDVWFHKAKAGSGNADSRFWFVFSGNGMEKSLSVLNSDKFVFSRIYATSVCHMAPISEMSFQINDFQGVSYFEPLYFKPPNITVARNP